LDDFLVYLLVLVVFTNRYVLGQVLKRLAGARFDETIEGFEPTVATITPLYNEGEHIFRTIKSLLALDYPKDKLEIIVIDDASTDDSVAWALRAAEGHPNVKVVRNPVNIGKRRAINRGHRETNAQIIVSVDSDVVVESGALRELLRRFTRPEIAAVGGRVMVANPHDNWLTRMQTVKFYFAQEWLKNIERTFKTVLCLSGCLTAYRREVLEELQPVLETRNVLGVPIKYGEDRFLTRNIVKAGYKTVFTAAARCYTLAPRTLSGYFSQQIRWRRSNFIDWFGGVKHVWKLPAPVAINYLSLFALMLVYPLLITEKVANGSLTELIALHVGLLGLLAGLYLFAARNMPASQRVGPLAFVSMALLLPVSYFVFTPLALFTLDSGSWETRGGNAAAAKVASASDGAQAAQASAQAQPGSHGAVEPMRAAQEGGGTQ
jgi:cellulose synthase/poly-beta-1,6-N-acetylglucosamine synthase-like glycosyltransferase